MSEAALNQDAYQPMAEPSQEKLLTYISAAFTFYKHVTGHLPTPKQVQSLLAIAGEHASLERITLNGDIVCKLEAESEQPRSGECIECGRFSSLLSPQGSCEGCVMQAAIDAQERT